MKPRLSLSPPRSLVRAALTMAQSVTQLSAALLPAALLPALALAVFSAQAGEAAPTRKGNVLGFGTDKSGGKLLSRAELRECLAEQPRLKTEGGELAREQAELDARKAQLLQQESELGAEAEALKGEEAKVDRGSQQAVDAYNQRSGRQAESLMQLRRDFDDYNARLPGFNARADAHTAAQERWNAACAKRPYSAADLEAVQSGQ